MAPVPPQQRRYLRAAPRPEAWAGLAETVMDRLGGPDRAEAALRATLAQLGQHHPALQPRTGPGRKSNGEHALNFYQYLLHEALPAYQERRREEAEAANENEEDPDEEEDAEVHEEEEYEEEEEEDDEIPSEAEETLESMDTETFIAQHNDLCEVCDGSDGELLLCSTCNLVFHLDCVRPEVKRLPTHRAWSCAYCIMALGLPVNSKPRRQAAAAVRLMARLRKRKIRERQARGALNEQEKEERRRLGLPVEEYGYAAAVEQVRDVAQESTDQAPTEQVGEEEEEKEVEKQAVKPDDAMEVEDEDEEEADRKPAAKSDAVMEVGEEDGDDAEEEEGEDEDAEEEEEEEYKGEEDENEDAEASEHGSEEGEAEDEENGDEEGEESSVVSEKLGSKKLSASSDAAVSSSDSTEVTGSKVEELEVNRKKRPAEQSEETGETKDDAKKQDGVNDDSKAEKPAAASESLDDTGGNEKERSDDKAAAQADNEGEDGGSGRISPRRSRKNPTIYNPQAGPASQWQTDELQEWKISHDEAITLQPPKAEEEEGGDSEKEPAPKESASVRARRAALNEDGAVWCNFCRDSPDIQICVFCACRVCFGKHDEKKLLICDRCDEEYHTFCLDPPLDAVPDSKQWFCPNCSEASNKLVEDSRSRRKAARRPESRKTPKQKRASRVPSVKTETVKKTLAKDRKKSKSGRRPGRPPKNPAAAEEVATAPRKRGRPPKNPASAESDRPRKRGRPPKSSASSRKRAKSEPPRRRGRPPSAKTLAKRAKEEADARKAAKAAEAAKDAKAAKAANASKRGGEHMSEADVRKALAAAAAAAAAAKPLPPSTKSRSGRTVKRSTFHDEFGQGMQMLQTSELMKHLQGSPDAADDDEKQSAIIPGSVDVVDPRWGSATAPMVAASSVSGASVSLKAPPGQASATAGATLQMANYPGLQAAAGAGAMSSSSTMATRGATNPAAAASHRSLSHASRTDLSKQPRRKPGARECMQISRRFGVKEIPEKYIEILMDYKDRGKLEHLIRMRERLDEHSRFLEAQLAGLEALVLEKGEATDIVVPLAPPEEE